MIQIKPPATAATAAVVKAIGGAPPSPQGARARALIGQLLLALSALCAAWSVPSQAQDTPQPKLPTVLISAGMHQIQAEVAQSSQQQMTGMMWRTQMGTHEGMLFVNPTAETRCFWMRNTLLPLAIAFIADDGTIVNIAEMQARSEKSHCSSQPVRFALEMNQGWFDKRGIRPGFKLKGEPFK
jgi:uncharacterized protein